MEAHNEIVDKLLTEYDADIVVSKSKDDIHAEVFDKHPITAMNEIDPSNTDRVLVIRDSWRPEWCREGVQVPVRSSEEQKKPEIKPISFGSEKSRNFVMPGKLIRHTFKYEFNSEKHCRMSEHFEFLYEIDPIDISWIEVSNIERQCLGLEIINESMIEIIFEVLERLCYKRIQAKVREAETEFLEHDENSKCDVCQSPEGEDGNELVFCEDCFVCVHQACYGIPELPSGSWICRHCDKCPNDSSKCLLCPNRGGAMKQIESDDDKWAHLSCAVWIPEVGFGNIDLMEPITRIDTIPQARWNLRCHLCKTSNTGAPIQCSERKCKMAFHVTCAINNNLVMKQEFQANSDVKLLAYCKQHSKKYMEPNASDSTTNMGPRDIKELRIQKQKEYEKTFQDFVTIKDLSEPLHEFSRQLVSPLKKISIDIQEKIYTYWILKRTSNHFQSLIKPPAVWREENQKQRVNNRSVFNAFCKIRFGLDRARLVVDMMVRREKKKAHLFDVMSQISHLQLQQLKNSRINPVLKDDPSLAGNWGFISTVHLDNNVYVNPDNLKDANLDYILQKMNLKKPSITDSHLEFSGKIKSKHGINRKDSLNLKRFMKKSSMFNNQDYTQSCVLKIPKEQLIVSNLTKQNIFKKLKEPVFVCHYLLPVLPDLLDSPKIEVFPKKEENDVSFATELPEESDSSNSLQDSKQNIDEYISPAPKKICVKICNEENQTIYQKNQAPRNIFDDFITEKL